MVGANLQVNLPSQLTAAAGNYAYVHLRIYGGTVAVVLETSTPPTYATSFIGFCFVRVDPVSGTLEPLAGLLN
jgi:hypothetical protein